MVLLSRVAFKLPVSKELYMCPRLPPEGHVLIVADRDVPGAAEPVDMRINGKIEAVFAIHDSLAPGPVGACGLCGDIRADNSLLCG
ncbi:hypothetical protein GCM10007285_04990 [Stappia taiwanensis]|nr:hypothetical protein GCM10007285_04990 [Stappia taiwanensis]